MASDKQAGKPPAPIEQNKCSVCGKPLSFDKEIGATCKEHAGKLRKYSVTADEVPEGYVRMSIVCRLANEQGISTPALVRAAGGDAATKPLLDPVFQVTYVGRSKWLHPDVLTKGFKLLKGSEEKAQTQKKLKSTGSDFSRQFVVKAMKNIEQVAAQSEAELVL